MRTGTYQDGIHLINADKEDLPPLPAPVKESTQGPTIYQDGIHLIREGVYQEDIHLINANKEDDPIPQPPTPIVPGNARVY
jgi:hypothetical protein